MWFVVCGVWCVVYGVWRMVRGVWCVACGVWGACVWVVGVENWWDCTVAVSVSDKLSKQARSNILCFLFPSPFQDLDTMNATWKVRALCSCILLVFSLVVITRGKQAPMYPSPPPSFSSPPLPSPPLPYLILRHTMCLVELVE